MAYALVRYTTVGTPVYESETGPNLGYDNIESGLRVMPADFDGDDFDPETYRSVEVVAELTDTELRALYRDLGKVVLRIGA